MFLVDSKTLRLTEFAKVRAEPMWIAGFNDAASQKSGVNAVLPGPVMLPPDLPVAEKAASIAATLVKRKGTPDHDVKAVLHFLDNDFVTGDVPAG